MVFMYKLLQSSFLQVLYKSLMAMATVGRGRSKATKNRSPVNYVMIPCAVIFSNNDIIPTDTVSPHGEVIASL